MDAPAAPPPEGWSHLVYSGDARRPRVKLPSLKRKSSPLSNLPQRTAPELPPQNPQPFTTPPPGITSIFLSLPRELRDIVYEMTFGSTRVELSSSGYEARNSGLLAACHQTRAEALKAYYNHTRFRLPETCFHQPIRRALTLLDNWTRTLPSGSVDHVRHVGAPLHLHYNDYHPDHCEHVARLITSDLVNKFKSVLGQNVLRIEKPTLGWYCTLRINSMEMLRGDSSRTASALGFAAYNR